jgi:hypothetical protein
MNSLENLRYRDSGKATRYTIDFNRHARKTGWNEQALLRQFYKGLPDRLKDEIARLGKPSGLKALQDMVVATLDQRYWERQTEINQDKKSAASTSTSTSAKPTSSDKSSSGQQSNGQKQDNRQQPKKDQKKPATTPILSTSSDKKTIANLQQLVSPLRSKGAHSQ